MSRAIKTIMVLAMHTFFLHICSLDTDVSLGACELTDLSNAVHSIPLPVLY